MSHTLRCVSRDVLVGTRHHYFNLSSIKVHSFCSFTNGLKNQTRPDELLNPSLEEKENGLSISEHFSAAKDNRVDAAAAANTMEASPSI